MGSFRQPPAHTRARPRGPVKEARLSHPTMFSSSFVLSLLLLGLASAYQLEDTFLEEYDEASDPRLFFSNFTSGLVAINTTLLTYGAMIVLGGGAIALHMYLLANSGANQRYANAYNQGYQGGNQGYNNNYHYANRRMFTGSQSGLNFDLLGLVSKAVEVYQKLNG